MTAVLRPCEATTFEGRLFAPLVAVVCGAPGHWWEAPSGKTYVLCDHHESVFVRAVRL